MNLLPMIGNIGKVKLDQLSKIKLKFTFQRKNEVKKEEYWDNFRK